MWSLCVDDLMSGCVCRELRGKYKHLARLVEGEEYERFISSLKKEHQLKKRIKDLVQYRKNGITKYEGMHLRRMQKVIGRLASYPSGPGYQG